MEGKNILILTSSYPSNQDKINTNFLSDLLISLSRKGINIYIVTPQHSNLPFRETQNGITIIRFPYWFTASGQKLGRSGGLTASLQNSPLLFFLLFPFCICQLLTALKVIREEKIEIIHSHWIVPQGLTGALIQLLTGIPHITSIHGTDIHLIHNHKFTHPLIRFIGHYTGSITTNSSYTHRLLLDLLPSVEKIQIIPMGIYPDEYCRKKSLQWRKNKKILFIGRLISWKGVNYLIHAMKMVTLKNPGYHLIIIGDGPKKGELEELSEKLMIRNQVFFLGEVERKTLIYLYHNADLFVLPSVNIKGQTEGLGVVLLEAMAAGIPVIGSNTGGIPDIIEDGVNGLLVPPGDPIALAEAINHILDDSYLSEKFRDAGLKTVKERFSWSIISDQFLKIYEEVLNN